MALDEDLEFSKLGTLVKQFKWDVVRQEKTDTDLVVVLKKPREVAAQPPGGAGAPATGIPT